MTNNDSTRVRESTLVDDWPGTPRTVAAPPPLWSRAFVGLFRTVLDSLTAVVLVSLAYQSGGWVLAAPAAVVGLLVLMTSTRWCLMFELQALLGVVIVLLVLASLSGWLLVPAAITGALGCAGALGYSKD